MEGDCLWLREERKALGPDSAPPLSCISSNTVTGTISGSQQTTGTELRTWHRASRSFKREREQESHKRKMEFKPQTAETENGDLSCSRMWGSTSRGQQGRSLEPRGQLPEPKGSFFFVPLADTWVHSEHCWTSLRALSQARSWVLLVSEDRNKPAKV